jgi:hypothetical protein
MKNKTILTFLLVLIFTSSFAQNKKADESAIAVYKLFSDANIDLKDSVAIYALNFEVKIKRLNGKSVVTSIAANDSLAFTIFPMYPKLAAIDFIPFMGTKSDIRLVIPILIYGNSPEKQRYHDQDGNALINFNAAINAAYALYNPLRYNNIKESKYELSNLARKAFTNGERPKSELWETVIMNPIWIEVTHVK